LNEIKYRRCQLLNYQEHHFRTVKDKIASKFFGIEKMRVLDTFLESSLNFLSNDIKNTTESSKVREKTAVKV